ncbi:hypothetical protein ACNKHP_15760 [Shigella boydii]
MWVWPIAIYLFLIGIFCRSGDAGRAVASLLPAGGRCRQYIAAPATPADCRATAPVILGLVILRSTCSRRPSGS